MKPTEPIQVIGLDCDDPYALEKLLRRSPDLLKQADMICGSRFILEKLRHDPQLSGRLLQLSVPLEPLYESIRNLHAQGMKVIVLADGDPLYFGVGASLVRTLKGENVTITPARSVVQAACQRLKLPWHDVLSISLHGREDIAPLFHAVGNAKPICILTGGQASPDILARLLLDRGVDWFEVHLFERMGTTDEKYMRMSLKDCEKGFFNDGVTMLLTPTRKPRIPKLGLDERRYRGNYSTKKPVRGAIFELLSIDPSNCVWDIGAGSGILGLEACSLAHNGRVVAIEKSMERCLDIQENRRILGAINLDICAGAAPDCLTDLPEPQRIFMGGGFSDPDATRILEKCIKALPRGGRFVASCVLLDSFMLCRKFLESLGWPVELMQLQASNAATLGPGKHFAPMNPVFLLATQKL